MHKGIIATSRCAFVLVLMIIYREEDIKDVVSTIFTVLKAFFEYL